MKEPLMNRINHPLSLAQEPARSALRTEELAVLTALRELQFGSLEVVVHHGRIVSLTRSEKQRFDGPAAH